jgi:hypothetical protein
MYLSLYDVTICVLNFCPLVIPTLENCNLRDGTSFSFLYLFSFYIRFQVRFFPFDGCEPTSKLIKNVLNRTRKVVRFCFKQNS